MSSKTHFQLKNKREPLIDTLVDEKEKTLKIVAEMPGVEKKDVNVVVGADKVIHIDAERGEKKLPRKKCQSSTKSMQNLPRPHTRTAYLN